MKFEQQLTQKIQASKRNFYGKENYNELRFGAYPKSTWKQLLKSRTIGHMPKLAKLAPYLNGLEQLHRTLCDTKSQQLLVELMAYRLMGFRKVRLSTNKERYWEELESVKKLKCSDQQIVTPYYSTPLEHYDLLPIGYDVRLFLPPNAIYIDFMSEQYAYKDEQQRNIVTVEQGDVVLDLGGCWGDTAIYFACKAGKGGQVYSFEFIEGNIDIFNKNTTINPQLADRINLLKNPVSDKSGIHYYYQDQGPSSQISLTPTEATTHQTTSVTIDEIVEKQQIEKVDFIKMDIEGAEPLALKGAIHTIQKFRPKLAIAIYHSMDDFVSIPKWIHDLNLGYELYLGHYTIHAEETIIFAKTKEV